MNSNESRSIFIIIFWIRNLAFHGWVEPIGRRLTQLLTWEFSLVGLVRLLCLAKRNAKFRHTQLTFLNFTFLSLMPIDFIFKDNVLIGIWVGVYKVYLIYTFLILFVVDWVNQKQFSVDNARTWLIWRRCLVMHSKLLIWGRWSTEFLRAVSHSPTCLESEILWRINR